MGWQKKNARVTASRVREPAPVLVCGDLHGSHGVALLAEARRPRGDGAAVQMAALRNHASRLRYTRFGLHQLQKPRPDVLTHFCYFFAFFYPIEGP